MQCYHIPNNPFRINTLFFSYNLVIEEMWRLGERKQGHSYLEQIEEITTYFKFINYYNILRLPFCKLYYLFLSALLLNVHKPCILATYVNIDTETNSNYTMYIKS